MLILDTDCEKQYWFFILMECCVVDFFSFWYIYMICCYTDCEKQYWFFLNRKLCSRSYQNKVWCECHCWWTFCLGGLSTSLSSCVSQLNFWMLSIGPPNCWRIKEHANTEFIVHIWCEVQKQYIKLYIMYSMTCYEQTMKIAVVAA